MFKKIVAGAMGALSVLNGLMMLIDGKHWYMTAPGVVSTGPFNAHFVADVGAAFLMAGLALLARSWRGRYWLAALTGAAFLAFHALIHIAEFIVHPHDFMISLTIVVMAALASWAALPSKGERESHA